MGRARHPFRPDPLPGAGGLGGCGRSRAAGGAARPGSRLARVCRGGSVATRGRARGALRRHWEKPAVKDALASRTGAQVSNPLFLKRDRTPGARCGRARRATRPMAARSATFAPSSDPDSGVPDRGRQRRPQFRTPLPRAGGVTTCGRARHPNGRRQRPPIDSRPRPPPGGGGALLAAPPVSQCPECQTVDPTDGSLDQDRRRLSRASYFMAQGLRA